MLNSLRDEVNFLFSGMGMPYQKVALMVAIVCTVFFTITLGNNTVQEAPVAVIDLDNFQLQYAPAFGPAISLTGLPKG